MTNKKTKLTILGQISYMKKVNGIKFSIVNEKDAADFLQNNTYYFKLKSYAKNFDKYQDHRRDKYVNLEFAYLKELSILDMHLRKIILKMTLDIEHSLKVQLISDISNNPDEDGYTMVQDFFNNYPSIKETIIRKSNSSVCKDLISKYHADYPIWAFVEILSFGEFSRLYEMYYTKYPTKGSFVRYLWSIRFIRNAAAHNNCLLNSLKTPYSNQIKFNKQVNTIISKFPNINRTARITKMNNPIIHDLVVMIVAFDKIIQSIHVKENSLKELKILLEDRFLRNKDFFSQNYPIKTSYEFIRVIVDEIYGKLYNVSTEQKH